MDGEFERTGSEGEETNNLIPEPTDNIEAEFSGPVTGVAEDNAALLYGIAGENNGIIAEASEENGAGLSAIPEGNEADGITAAEAASSETADKKPGKEREKKGTVASLLEWVELFAVSVAVVMTILVCIGRHSPVIGSSMNDTLRENDLLIISDLFYTPKQGDIVVFESKKTTYEKPYVKRIIATAGQTVDYNKSTGEVKVDGKLMYEDYALYKGIERTSYNADIIYPYTVPEGCVFVMGDNRWNSTDSRDIGPVDQRCIIGRVICRLFPINDFKSF